MYGRYLDPAHLGQRFDRLLKDAMLPDVRFHDLRHSANKGSSALVVLLLQPAIVKMMQKNIVSSLEIISEVLILADAFVSPDWFPSAADRHWGFHFYHYGSSAQPNSLVQPEEKDVKEIKMDEDFLKTMWHEYCARDGFCVPLRVNG